MKGRYAAKRDARLAKMPALEWAWACSSNGGGGHVPRIDRIDRLAGLFDNSFTETTCQLCARMITRDAGSLDREFWLDLDWSWHIPLLLVQELP